MVTDHDAALDFYAGTLGFEVVQDAFDGRKRWLTVRPPGAETALVLAVGADPAPSRVAYFLETDDFARDHEAMRAAGVAFEEEPRSEPYGRVAVWRDPFGNRWDLIEPRTGARRP
jgi:catechol 2,3-dioxygenase-like lactoylglutathione lyase family enzyme